MPPLFLQGTTAREILGQCPGRRKAKGVVIYLRNERRGFLILFFLWNDLFRQRFFFFIPPRISLFLWRTELYFPDELFTDKSIDLVDQIPFHISELVGPYRRVRRKEKRPEIHPDRTDMTRDRRSYDLFPMINQKLRLICFALPEGRYESRQDFRDLFRMFCPRGVLRPFSVFHPAFTVPCET